MPGFLNRIADVDGLACLECIVELCQAEGNRIIHLITLLVLQVELDVLHLLAHDLARTGISDIARDEHRLAVAGTIGIEHAQVAQQCTVDVAELDLAINIHCRGNLLVLNMFLDILGETPAELGNVLLLDGQSHGVGVAAKGLQQVTTRLYGSINVETTHRTRGDNQVQVGQLDIDDAVILRQP